jgi:hypothetical protein
MSVKEIIDFINKCIEKNYRVFINGYGGVTIEDLNIEIYRTHFRVDREITVKRIFPYYSKAWCEFHIKNISDEDWDNFSVCIINAKKKIYRKIQTIYS